MILYTSSYNGNYGGVFKEHTMVLLVFPLYSHCIPFYEYVPKIGEITMPQFMMVKMAIILNSKNDGKIRQISSGASLFANPNDPTFHASERKTLQTHGRFFRIDFRGRSAEHHQDFFPVIHALQAHKDFLALVALDPIPTTEKYTGPQGQSGTSMKFFVST